MTIPAGNTLADERARLSKPWAAWGAVFASLLLFAAVRSPVPGVNEPHYLCKAKHYWDSAWCPGDFFLESSNAHLVFYQTVGIFTRVLSLEQTAWLGRLAALGLLAWGWVRLIPKLVPGRWTSLWAMWLYLAIAAAGNWSGEWMVGGVEGKGFSYACGFWAMAAWFDRQIKWTAFFAGLGVSFHPVVGGWIVIAAGVATLITWLIPARLEEQPAGEREPIPVRDWAIALGIFVLACLPGIWPAMELLSDGDLRQAQIVARIQVFYRIQHHLDPMQFSRAAYTAYGLLAVVWFLLRFRVRWGAAERWFAWFTAASIGIAVIGVGLGYGERPIESLEQITWRYRLLKFYPFRLADIMLPVAASITFAGLVARGLQEGFANPWGSPKAARNRCWLLFSCFFMYSLLAPAIDHNPSRMEEEQLRDWLDVCRWIREETPTDTIVWTPPNSWAFKWYAQRAEYVSRKDCPQDAEGIIEWNKRMGHRLGEAFKNEPRLAYAILRIGTMTIEPVYQNETYRIYDLSVFSRE